MAPSWKIQKTIKGQEPATTSDILENHEETTEAGNKTEISENKEDAIKRGTKSKMTENIEETTEAGNKSVVIPDEPFAWAHEKLGEMIPLAKAMQSCCILKQEKVTTFTLLLVHLNTYLCST